MAKPACPNCNTASIVFLYGDMLAYAHSDTEEWQCWNCGQIFSAPKPPQPPVQWPLRKVKPLQWRKVE